jgi:hypothetical protein
MPAARRFPSPWRADKMPGGYVVRDANGQALAYVYSRANEAEAMQAKVLTEDEARRVAAQSEFAKNKPLATLDGHRHNSGPHRVFTSRYPRSEPCRMAQRQ